ncbi:MAG: enolase C-terminal domain-like protein, partial [Myxococcota bacterium]|nr:enolase C-terminal domain-like protein [Myxococcota bacterium]
ARQLVGSEIDSADAGLGAAARDLARAPAARAALDAALRDLEAREIGTSLAASLGANARARVPTALLLGAEHADGAAAEARRAGFRVLKLKLGTNAFDADRARVAAVREAIGNEVALRVDANGAWSEATAAAHLEALASLDVELVEQPLASEALEALARLRRASPVPLAADESVRDVASAERVLRFEAADVLVVKPAAVGGLGSALSIARRAREAQVEVLVTTFLDTAIGRAGALHLAAALPPGRHAAGLATGSLLADDLAPGPVPKSGAIALPSDNGLGFSPDPAALTRLTRGETLEVYA